MRVFHVTSKTLRASADLTDRTVAAVLWGAMRRAFPDALAACLMPDHPHLLAPARDASDARQRFGHVISGLRRSREGASTRWESVAEPDEVCGSLKLQRNVRYIALNPCRRGLCDDPLAWPWSTHRDAIGAIVDPWPQASYLARALGRSERDFARWLHGYVSGDPSVASDGTPFPIAAPRSDQPVHGLGLIVAAAAASLRGPPEAAQFSRTQRAVFLRLAFDCGWRNTAQLATAVGLSQHGVRLCLGDARLRAGVCD